MDILGVDDVDTICILANQLDDVGATAGQVASVQAQPDRGVVEYPDHLVVVLDHRPPVRVEAGGDLAAGADLADAIEIAEQGVPTCFVKDGACVVPVTTGIGGEDEIVAAGGLEGVELLVDHGDRVEIRIVHDGEEEGSDGFEVVLLHLCGAGFGLDGQPALGAELGGGEADLPHLGENALRCHLIAPARDLADTPADGCSSNLHRCAPCVLRV